MRLAVIPARGGSKRIPRKNIRPFCGKPLIAWSILAAQDAGVFDRIIVSTDDDEIAELAVRGWANQLAYASHRIKNMKKFQKLFLKDQIKKIVKESANKNLNKIILDEDLHRG